MGPEDDEVHSEHVVGRLQLLFYGVLGDAITVLRLRLGFLSQGNLPSAVDRDGGREHETIHVVVHRRVDQVDAPDQVVLVVESFDEVAQALCGVGSQMVDAFEALGGEELMNEGLVANASRPP